jgi:hypothetical protein
MDLSRSDQGDQGDRQLLTFFIKGCFCCCEELPHPFIFLGSSTLIALITLITPFKPLTLRCVSSDQDIKRGKTLQCILIAFIWLKVLI